MVFAMIMLILDATTKSITAVMAGAAATTNPDWTATYADSDAITLVEGASDGVLNGTSPITLVAAPAASTRRIIKSLTIYNKDTAAVIVTLNYVSAGGTRFITKVTLQAGDTFTLDGTYDLNGELKTSFPGGVTDGDFHEHLGCEVGDGSMQLSTYALDMTDSSNNDAIVGMHGFLIKGVKPAAGLLNVPGISNADDIYVMKPMFDTTNPAAIGTAAPGSQIIAARRDHVHANVFASLAEVLAGTVTDKSISPAVLKGRMKFIQKFITNPQLVYAQRPQIFLMRTFCAISIIEIHIACYDYSPGAELAGDLKWADDMNNGVLGNAAVLHIMDTTNGVCDITAHDLNVAAGKFVYFSMDASPHADIKDFYIEVDYTDD